MHNYENSFLERQESDGVKGILILMILLGHNMPLVMMTNGCMGMVWLYHFHIHAFFLISYLYPQKKLSWRKTLDYLVRFYTPFIIGFFLLSTITFCRGIPVQSWAKAPLTLVCGGAFFIREYTGTQFLWFLPAIFAATIIRCGYQALSSRVKQIFFIICGLIALNEGLHIVQCEQVDFYFHYWLLGCKYLFWGLIFRWILSHLNYCRWMPPAVFLIGSIVFFVRYLYFIKPYHYGYPPGKIDFFLAIGLSFSYLSSLYLLRQKLCQNRFIRYLGHNSMIIYLTHIYFGYIAYWLLAKCQTPLITSAICCLGAMLGSSCVCIKIMSKYPLLSKFFLPTNWEDSLYSGLYKERKLLFKKYHE